MHLADVMPRDLPCQPPQSNLLVSHALESRTPCAAMGVLLVATPIGAVLVVTLGLRLVHTVDRYDHTQPGRAKAAPWAACTVTHVPAVQLPEKSPHGPGQRGQRLPLWGRAACTSQGNLVWACLSVQHLIAHPQPVVLQVAGSRKAVPPAPPRALRKS